MTILSEESRALLKRMSTDDDALTAAAQAGWNAAIEAAAAITERFCACDDRDVQDDVNFVLRNKAQRIRALKDSK